MNSKDDRRCRILNIVCTVLLLAICSGGLKAQPPDYAWVKTHLGSGEDEAMGVATDASGNIYVAGNFVGNLSMEQGSPYNNSDENEDIFIAKYDNNGNLLWSKHVYGVKGEVHDIAVDGSGNCVIAGTFAGTLNFDSQTSMTGTSGSYDLFVAKYNTNGNLVWARQSVGPGGEIARGVAVDGYGNVIITGSFTETVNFGTISLTSTGITDIYVAKYSSNGLILWARQAIGHSGSLIYGTDLGIDVAVDNGRNIYVTGYIWRYGRFGDIVVTGESATNAFLVKYNENGTALWAKIMGGVAGEMGRAVAVDASGNCIVAGTYTSMTTFEIEGISIPHAGYEDIFIAKFTSGGNLVWAKYAGGVNPDFVNGIVTDASGNFYITGTFYLSAVFGQEPPVVGEALTGEGSHDIFIAKYDGNGAIIWAKQTGGPEEDVSNGIALDNNGDAVITGKYEDGVHFDWMYRSSFEEGDVFVAKLNDLPLLTVTAVWWGNEVDVDADGYVESATLYWRPVLLGSEQSVYYTIYWKDAQVASWQGSTNASSRDLYSVVIDWSHAFRSQDVGVVGQMEMDFKIRMGKNFMTSMTPFWEFGPDDFSALNNYKMETSVTPTMPSPTDLICLNGYHQAIPLTWKAPSSGTPQGYNLYRDSQKIASNLTRTYYRDEPVTNGKIYNYKVTAVYSGGESGFSNTFNGAAMLNGYYITAGWASSAPTLDGNINSSEWSNAATTVMSYPGEPGTVRLYVMNDANYLYFAVDDGVDNSLGNDDTFGIVFDDNHDRELPSSASSREGLIQMYWNGSATNAYLGTYGYFPDNLGWDSWTTPAGVSQGIALTSGHVHYEGRIDLNISPLVSSRGNNIGIGFYTWDGASSSFTGIWPEPLLDLQNYASGFGYFYGPFSYGDIVLANQTSPTHTVSTPNTPSGPSTGQTNQSYSYSTGGSSCSQGHNVQYRFDWGSGVYSSWGSSTSRSYTWSSAGTYQVKAQARCATNTSVVSNWSEALTVTISYTHTVSKPNRPSGPSSGETNQSYSYSTGGSSCSQGHNVQYRFGWRAGVFSSWGSSTNRSHTWSSAGTYQVKTQARCATNTSVVSDWSEALTVTISSPVFWADTDGDGDIDIFDIMAVAVHWNTQTGDPEYDSRYDFDDDGDIDIFDIMAVAVWWNRQPPSALARGVEQAAKQLPSQAIRFRRVEENGFEAMEVSVEHAAGLAGFEVELVSTHHIPRITSVTLGQAFIDEGNRAMILGPDVSDDVSMVKFGVVGYGEGAGITGSGVLARVVFSEEIGSISIGDIGCVDDEGRILEGFSIENDFEEGSPVALPSQFDLLQNYPNPFNPETVIDFRIKEACDVVLVVYTVKGETIRTLVKDYRDAGSYSVVWDGRDDRGSRVPSGIYFYRMEAGTTHLYRKMILLR